VEARASLYNRSVCAIRAAATAAVLSFVSIGSVATAGTGRSLSGAWFFGTYEPEPKEAVISVPQRCWNGGVDFMLQETGTKLTGMARWIQATGGVMRPPREETETMTGTRDGNHIVLSGQHRVVIYGQPSYPSLRGGDPDRLNTTVTYDIRFDPRTRHLVGTRNGQPLWLARFKIHPANCGSPPP